MALWGQICPQLPNLGPDLLSDLYPETFPLDIRFYLANWIEEQQWESFDVDSLEQEPQARMLLEQMIIQVQEVAQQRPNVVERVKLQHISRNLGLMYRVFADGHCPFKRFQRGAFQSQPMLLIKTVRDLLRKERHILAQMGTQFPSLLSPPHANGTPQSSMEDSKREVNSLQLKVVEIQNCRQTLHQFQEDLNWEKESLQGQNELEPQKSELVARQTRIQQLEYNYSNCAEKRLQLLHEAMCALEHCQSCLIHRIESWRWEQHRSTIGLPFEDNLSTLQTWSEQLLIINGTLRQELMLMKRDHGEAEQFQPLQEKLTCLLKTLVQSSLLVEKHPPQVIKTQSKFSTTVRYLLGEKMAPGKPVLLKAQIITEMQARNLSQQGLFPNETVGELLNSTAVLEHNTSSKSTCAIFRNMSIKRIKRADRKGSESVTEEKFALLFTTELTITGCESPYGLQTISLPVVVIVHGSQEINAMATIVWDCAFSEPNRIPFVVPERVPWKQMCEALSSKFMCEVQTNRGLDRYNLHFLAQKIFDQPDDSGDFSNMLVSWAQFNKEVLPGRNFTFWQWFEGVMDLTKKCLRDYWTDGLIFGFIGKQHIHVILQSKPSGTFLLRFSDSEMGGISIAYVGPTENGGRRIQNIQPFTKKDLDKRGLGDQLRDISCISHVYPDLAKNEVFKKYFTETPPNPDGYVPFKVKTVVNPDDMSSQSLPVTDPMNVFQPISSTYGQPMNEDMFRQYPHCTPPYMPETPMSQTIFSLTAPQANPIESLDMDDIAGILQSI